MDVCFLDIDDVLNSVAWADRCRASGTPYIRKGHIWLDKEAVMRLNRLADAGVKFVISSVWRMEYSAKKIQEHLTEQGFTGKVIGSTPVLGPIRGAEIQDWLSRHPDVDNFVILDDMNEKHFGAVSTNLIHVTDGKGLLDSHVDAALDRLKSS